MAFYNHIGSRPSLEYTLDRIDNAKGYEPGNVRWATVTQQSRNKRSLHRLTFRGETKSIVEWSEKLGIKQRTIWMRLDAGWSVEKALTMPSRKYERHMITFNGKTQSRNEWARELGMKERTLRMRLESGWSVERAFTEPVGPPRRKSSRLDG